MPTSLADTVLVAVDGDQATVDAMALLVEAADLWAFDGQEGSLLPVIEQTCAQIPALGMPTSPGPVPDQAQGWDPAPRNQATHPSPALDQGPSSDVCGA